MLVFLIIINIVIGFLCVWINYDIIQLSALITVIYMIFIFVVLNKRQPNKNLPTSLKILSLTFVFLLCFISYSQSPKYSYNDAQNIIVNNLNKQVENIHLGELKTKQLKLCKI